MNDLGKISVKRVKVDEAYEGQRLDNFLLGQLKGVPKSRILQAGAWRRSSPTAGTELAKGSGSVTYRGEAMEWDSEATSIAEWAPPLVRLEGPPSIRFNLHGQLGQRRCLLHLLNYAPARAENIRIRLAIPARRITLLTPDSVPAGKLKLTHSEAGSEFTVPALDIYSLVVMQPGLD